MVTFCGLNRCQLSLKELAIFDDEDRFEKMRGIFEGTGIYLIEDRDYNVYFMPDNTITTTFQEATQEVAR